ncbi:hypothetical protein H5410_017634 [Solanum commersonii]|uniref:Uncharacterized protein n=1 Tax=Solanum commersonii TaxID=4109 RepID=A0A9J6A0K4_SOLCO|nr:hypothetical protein H5410_017634 [Solanum commersonii]
MGYAHVQKEIRKIPYAPIVVQVIKVAIIIALLRLSFAKDNMTQKTQKLAPEIVIHASHVARGTRVATILVKTASLFVKERVYIEPKACTLECDSRVAYMTCPFSGLAKLYQVCVNCCTVGEDSKLYEHDESLICTEEPQKSELYIYSIRHHQ